MGLDLGRKDGRVYSGTLEFCGCGRMGDPPGNDRGGGLRMRLDRHSAAESEGLRETITGGQQSGTGGSIKG